MAVTEMTDIMAILRLAVEKKASDIHLVIGKPPMFRVHGEMSPLEGAPPLTPERTREMVYAMLLEDQRRKFEEEWELDCSFQVQGLCRFRMNVLMHRNGIGCVMRLIPTRIPTPQEIGLPPQVIRLAELPRGMVLVTGPTGSGKSTTLAALIEVANQKRKDHILTMEDPIEFVFESKNCVITQREIGSHSKSFAAALKRALRQDPDIVLVGEMRDLETISTALTIAESGHLVFATLHTTDAAQTVDRIIDVFPPYQQQQVRTQLSGVLQAVISQTLLPRRGRASEDILEQTAITGRVASREIMMVTPAIANLIREGKTHMIYGAIETGAKFGMVSLDQDLARLVREGLVSAEDALAKAHNPQTLQQLLKAAAPSAAAL